VAPLLTQKLDRDSSNDVIGKPLVMISTNCWDVGTCVHTYMTKSHLFPNKMNIKLDVLGTALMDRVGGEIEGRDVIVVHHRGLVDRARKLK
jgi:hypothetical protein